MTQVTPFRDRESAAYWAGGVLADVPGGCYSLHARTTPAGPELYYVGVGPDGAPKGADGWPDAVRGRYVFATPNNGGRMCICRCPDPA